MSPKEIAKYLEYAPDDLDLIVVDRVEYQRLLMEHIKLKEIKKIADKPV